MLGNIFGSDTLIVIMVALVVLFGGSQLPKLAKNVGAAGHEFRRAQREAEADNAMPAPAVVAPSNVLVSRDDLRQELARLVEEKEMPPVS
jgi:sec-independent protein translocase protein TatA